MSVTSGIQRATRYLEDRGYEVIRIDLTSFDLGMLEQEWNGMTRRNLTAVRERRFNGVLVETSPFMPRSVVVAKDVLGAEIEEDILP